MDSVIEAYTGDVDRALLRENLKLTPSERMERLEASMVDLMALRESRHPAAASPQQPTPTPDPAPSP